jgi:hypothetical protein
MTVEDEWLGTARDRAPSHDGSFMFGLLLMNKKLS